MSLIERARQELSEREELKEVAKGLFFKSNELLAGHGQSGRSLWRISNWLSHQFNFGEQPVSMFIYTLGKLGENDRIQIHVDGAPEASIFLHKKKRDSKEEFFGTMGSVLAVGYRKTLDIETAKEYQELLTHLEKELNPSKEEN